MAEGHERARPVVSRRAGFHPDQARRKGAEESRYLAAAQHLAQDDLSTSVDAVQLEDILRDIKSDRDNLRHERGSSPVLGHAHSGTSDAGGGRHPRHHINGEYYPVLVNEKSRAKENQRVGLCKTGARLAAERLYSVNVTSPITVVILGALPP